IADPQPAQVVKPRERALHDPAFFAEPRTVLAAAPRDHGLHAPSSQLASVLIVVIATIGEHPLGAPPWTPALASDRADSGDQRQQLCDVVAMPAGQADRERDPARVGD